VCQGHENVNNDHKQANIYTIFDTKTTRNKPGRRMEDTKRRKTKDEDKNTMVKMTIKINHCHFCALQGNKT
jgi:hypothetical protein